MDMSEAGSLLESVMFPPLGPIIAKVMALSPWVQNVSKHV
jgi:hypothetical protein